MTDLDQLPIPTPASAPPPADRSGAWPLGRHELALAALLLAVIPLAGLDSVWSADEGALLYQASTVEPADGGGSSWSIAHPFPAADPDGTSFPFHLSVLAEDGGYLVLAKHAVLVRLAAALHALGGYPLVIALSALGTFLAAVATGRLAALVDPRAGRPALWLAGVASPLFISSYVAWGHTIAAALVGWAVFLLLGPVVRERPRVEVLAGGALLAGAGLIRTEAVLAGVAVALGLAATATLGSVGRDPNRRAAWLWSAGAALVATGLGFVVDGATAIPDAGLVRPEPNAGPIWSPAARFDGFTRTWLQTSYTRDLHDLLTLTAAVAVITAGVLARRLPERAPLVRAAFGLAAVALAARFASSPTMLVPGLVIAFPLLFAGGAMVGRDDLGQPVTRACGAGFALFCLAVLATQYRYGGGGEWGGRYFALGLPLGIAAATPAALRRLDAISPSDRRRLLVYAAVPVLLMMIMGVNGMRTVRHRTAELAGAVQQATAAAGDGDPRPVVVTTVKPLARWAWDDVDDGRWLLVPPEELPPLMARLRILGVERLVLVTEGAATELDVVSPWYRPAPDGPGTGPDAPPGWPQRMIFPLVAPDA